MHSYRRALVVDDEGGVRTVLRRYLQRLGWEVVEGTDGAHAVALLDSTNDRKQNPFELVICDLRMPRFSGPELYQWMTQNRPDLIDRVIFSSGDVRDPAAATFLTECRCPVLEKPFELTELTRVVDEISESPARDSRRVHAA